jgi:hypothetical protein
MKRADLRLASKRLLGGGAVAIVLLGALYVPTLSAQPAVQDLVAPPPLKIITHQERSQLEESNDPKARIKATLELAEAHLANLEKHTAAREFDDAATEAGMYWALVENALIFLKKTGSESNRKRDLYKRVELALRAQGPRLNAVRRTTPAEYSVWIKEIETFARKGRTEALNSFYGDTVVRDTPLKSKDAKERSKPPQEN